MNLDYESIEEMDGDGQVSPIHHSLRIKIISPLSYPIITTDSSMGGNSGSSN